MMRAAVFSGADCVYIGVKGFNARRGAGNFAGEGLREAVAFCHARGCRVYAALNTLVLPGREGAFDDAVCAIAQAGCDAVIVQDLSAAARVRALAPGLALHASTQLSVHSLAGVRQLAALGFSRAILARELSMDEIAAIGAASPIELEIFVHGALCVSVSGQCAFSVQLGGRSANQGACASPCRLRISWPEAPAPAAAKQDACLLSLKDLSVLDALPKLASIGVCSAKIEGRLRGPEYAAMVVDAARKAREGQPYDKTALRDIFSRSGFTDGWFTGRGGGEMFGSRTEADGAATRDALPAARALYRREMPRVPVAFCLRLEAAGGTLEVSDGEHCLSQPLAGPLAPAQNPPDEALAKALAKTGGTPFYVRPEDIDIHTAGLHIPLGVVNAARRALLEALLEARSAAPASAPCKVAQPATQAPAPPREKPAKPARVGWFAEVEMLPKDSAAFWDELVFPLDGWEAVPPALRAKSWLAFPRVLFGPREAAAAAQAAAAAKAGFAGFEVNNIAHFVLAEGLGLPLRGGMGLNLTNARAVQQAAALGCRALTLSFELSLRQMEAIAASPEVPPAVRLDALCYGHLPTILTRACPLQAGGQRCAGCAKAATLRDRKGVDVPLRCRHGMRELYNPRPLWMADRMDELPTDGQVWYFALEDAAMVQAVQTATAAGQPAPGFFTRGLYDRGVEE